MEVDVEGDTGVPLLSGSDSLLVDLVGETVVDEAVVALISTNDEDDISEGGILGKAPVFDGDLLGGVVLQLVGVDGLDHVIVGVDGMLLKVTDETVAGSWEEDVEGDVHEDEAELDKLDDDFLVPAEGLQVHEGEEMHSLVLGLVHQGLGSEERMT